MTTLRTEAREAVRALEEAANVLDSFGLKAYAPGLRDKAKRLRDVLEGVAA